LQPLTRFSSLISHDCNLLVGVVQRCLTLWLCWTLTAIFGGMLSLLVWRTMTGFIGGRLEWRTLEDLGGGTLSLFVGFLPLFAVQRLVLHRHLQRMNSWVLRSSVGICLGTYVQRVAIFVLGIFPASTSGANSQALGAFLSTQLFWGRALGLFVLWGVVGGAQWLVLRHRVRHAGWWVLVSAFAGASSGAVAVVVGFGERRFAPLVPGEMGRLRSVDRARFGSASAKGHQTSGPATHRAISVARSRWQLGALS
jgi:hypothetical protein